MTNGTYCACLFRDAATNKLQFIRLLNQTRKHDDELTQTAFEPTDSSDIIWHIRTD